MIPEPEALETIAKHRGDGVFILSYVDTAWPKGTAGQLELPFVGCMGKISSFALGLALARPDRKIVVLDGDGSLLMNLGSLVTMANMNPPNLVYFVLENDVYQTTGGHPIPGAGRISFSGLAKAAGFTTVYEFDMIDEFQKHVKSILSDTGLTFVCLKVTTGGKRRPITRLLTTSLPRFKVELEKSLPKA
ncbi:MAG: thiamine pyrophosphate-dependent enzyme [Chloroflexota bacterium]